jgi:hypothetical protein
VIEAGTAGCHENESDCDAIAKDMDKVTSWHTDPQRLIATEPLPAIAVRRDNG